jgi:hypothetical protein
MSSFLSQLGARSIGAVPYVSPRKPSRFEARAGVGAVLEQINERNANTPSQSEADNRSRSGPALGFTSLIDHGPHMRGERDASEHDTLSVWLRPAENVSQMPSQPSQVAGPEHIAGERYTSEQEAVPERSNPVDHVSQPTLREPEPPAASVRQAPAVRSWLEGQAITNQPEGPAQGTPTAEPLSYSPGSPPGGPRLSPQFQSARSSLPHSDRPTGAMDFPSGDFPLAGHPGRPFTEPRSASPEVDVLGTQPRRRSLTPKSVWPLPASAVAHNSPALNPRDAGTTATNTGPVIEVRIGRIELSAILAREASPKTARPTKSIPSLADYLKQ